MGTKNNKQKSEKKQPSISITNSAYSTETSASITNVISINSITTRDSKSKSSLSSEIFLINKLNNINSRSNSQNRKADAIFMPRQKTNENARASTEDRFEPINSLESVELRKKCEAKGVRFSQDITMFRFERKSRDSKKSVDGNQSEAQELTEPSHKKTSLFPASKIFKLIRAAK